MDLMDLVLHSAIMKFQEDFCMQVLGIVMGTNLAPILTNIYMLEEELYIICKKKNIVQPKILKIFIDDGLVLQKATRRIFDVG